MIPEDVRKIVENLPPEFAQPTLDFLSWFSSLAFEQQAFAVGIVIFSIFFGRWIWAGLFMRSVSETPNNPQMYVAGRRTEGNWFPGEAGMAGRESPPKAPPIPRYIPPVDGDDQ